MDASNQLNEAEIYVKRNLAKLAHQGLLLQDGGPMGPELMELLGLCGFYRIPLMLARNLIERAAMEAVAER